MKLREITEMQYNKTNNMIQNDMNKYGDTTSVTQQEGRIFGLINLHLDVSDGLEKFFEDRNADKLKVIKLMLQDELKYVELLMDNK